jgi:hypothetical protein
LNQCLVALIKLHVRVEVDENALYFPTSLDAPSTVAKYEGLNEDISQELVDVSYQVECVVTAEDQV